MNKNEVIVLVILAFIGYVFVYYFRAGTKGNVPLLNAVSNPVEAGSADVVSKQDVYGSLGIPIADYSNGPVFYIANQPWYFQSQMGNVMPLSAGSSNVVGAPSAQVTAGVTY